MPDILLWGSGVVKVRFAMGQYQASIGAPTGDPAVMRYPSKDTHPAFVLLARLGSPNSRRRIRASLEGVARLLTDDMESWSSFCWHQLRYQHLVGLRANLAERYAPSTVNQMLSAVRQVLKECWRLGYLDADSYYRAVDIGHLSYTRLPAGRALSDGELAALFLNCAQDDTLGGVRDGALLAVLYGTGVRRAELVALDVIDINLERATLRVRHGKGDKEREQPLPPGTVEALRAWLLLRGDEPGPLFMSIHKHDYIIPRRLAQVSVGAIIKRRAEQAEVAGLSAHDLRRTFITHLLDADVDLATTQKLAGHANPMTTTRYDRRGDEAKVKAVAKLNIPVAPPREVRGRMGQVHR